MFVLFQKGILFHNCLTGSADSETNLGFCFDVLELFHKYLMWFKLFHIGIGVGVLDSAWVLIMQVSLKHYKIMFHVLLKFELFHKYFEEV
jgi:hypothetical protein